MKILYAVQCTGNGHIARAQEILPLLQAHGEVHLMTSGHQAQINIGYPATYKAEGISLIYNKAGGVSYSKTLLGNNLWKAAKTIKHLPVQEYDVVINDFEPLSAYACKLKGVDCFELSHQAALLKPEVPKPQKKDFLGEMVLKHYSPSTHKIGFHFQSYAPGIYPPVIRHKIKELTPSEKGGYVVYLPSFQDAHLQNVLAQIPVDWVVFTKYSTQAYRHQNIRFQPIDEQVFLQEFANAKGVLCSAGFETPSETLYFGKKLMVIPIAKQYEQACNAEALRQLGISVSSSLHRHALEEWLNQNKTMMLEDCNNLSDVLDREIFSKPSHLDKQSKK